MSNLKYSNSPLAIWAGKGISRKPVNIRDYHISLRKVVDS